MLVRRAQIGAMEGVSESTKALCDYLERLENEPLLPRGWRFRLVLQFKGYGVINLDYQSDKGGGSYAEAKIRTLELDPTAITSDISLEQYKKHIQTLAHTLFINEEYPSATQYNNLRKLEEEEAEQFLEQLAPYTDLKDVPRSILDPIRDRTGLSPFGGGISIPGVFVPVSTFSSGFIYREEAAYPPMRALVALSGAVEASDDLVFALGGFKAFVDDNSNITFLGTAQARERYDNMLSRLQATNLNVWRMMYLLR